MEQKTVGAQTRRLRTCPSVLSFAAVGGRFEGEGPLREYFDELSEDHFFGEKTWEKGESTMQRHALSRALEKVGLKVSASARRSLCERAASHSMDSTVRAPRWARACRSPH